MADDADDEAAASEGAQCDRSLSDPCPIAVRNLSDLSGAIPQVDAARYDVQGVADHGDTAMPGQESSSDQIRETLRDSGECESHGDTAHADRSRPWRREEHASALASDGGG